MAYSTRHRDKEGNPRMVCSICKYGEQEEHYPFTPFGLALVPSRIAQCPKCKKQSRHDFYKEAGEK